MMSEMWPTTLAYRLGFKAVYSPIPVWFDHDWPDIELEKILNAGPGGQVGGSLDTVINQEFMFEGSTWFWNARLPMDLYRRWLNLTETGAGSPEVCLPTSFSLINANRVDQ
jgi:hypothetical protein